MVQDRKIDHDELVELETNRLRKIYEQIKKNTSSNANEERRNRTQELADEIRLRYR
jgi:hypothetical protein